MTPKPILRRKCNPYFATIIQLTKHKSIECQLQNHLGCLQSIDRCINHVGMKIKSLHNSSSSTNFNRIVQYMEANFVREEPNQKLKM